MFVDDHKYANTCCLNSVCVYPVPSLYIPFVFYLVPVYALCSVQPIRKYVVKFESTNSNMLKSRHMVLVISQILAIFE